ncbi:hypothetical protein FRB95_012332 [Tulasnella sp. JGI-2019a]|nr:hypothetical protein FRB95_012332 [Tulasnella sp. JGI-2019a]
MSRRNQDPKDDPSYQPPYKHEYDASQYQSPSMDRAQNFSSHYQSSTGAEGHLPNLEAVGYPPRPGWNLNSPAASIFTTHSEQAPSTKPYTDSTVDLEVMGTDDGNHRPMHSGLMELRKSEVETGWRAAVWPKSKYCRAYLLTVIAETVVDMAIEAAILQQLDVLDNNIANTTDQSEFATTQTRQPIYLGIFVLAHFLQMILAMDAVYNKNTLQFLFLALFNFTLLIYGALQVVEVQTNINQLVGAGSNLPSIPIHALIALVPCVIALAEVAYIALGYQIWKEFGWKVYKFLGADRNIRRLYGQYQVFQCLLKFDIFFWVGFSVQWMVLIPIERFELWATIVALPLAILLLVEGYLAARHENKWMMGSFMLGCVAGCAYFGYKAWKIFEDKNTETFKFVWKSLIIFACVSIVLLILTFVSATIVMLNFSRGLKENMNKKEKQHQLERRATAFKGGAKGAGRIPPVDVSIKRMSIE